MKKAVSLLFALTILLSGMHLSFATHYCSGEKVDARFTFGQKATICCTENASKNDGLVLKSNCCTNTLSSLNVDAQYVLSAFDFTAFSVQHFQLFILPAKALPFCQTSFLTTISNVKPPGNLRTSTVELSKIQVFVI